MSTTTRRHSMPFGAELLEDGRVRFALWAPAATQVDLCIDNTSANGSDPQNPIPMAAHPDGWFRLDTDRAMPGTRYRFRIDGDIRVPDPASRFQPDDVHGDSVVVDPGAWRWRDSGWIGRPWEEAVIYELHAGSFTPQGDFSGVCSRLDYLAELGVTAIELMPVADFPGRRNWGYDGVCLFAADSRYGDPDALKALIDAAHARGLMVFLDVVYNHFGPDGNYLHLYAPQFFTAHHATPWGAGLNYDGESRQWVREFFVHNALYWLEEYHFDGLRLDAVHAIADDSHPDILVELAERVRAAFGEDRHIHLVLENDHNAARYLDRDGAHRPKWYAAQWNDDIHHALHVLMTGQTDGYYQDYARRPLHHLARCLSEGFAYQGEPSAWRRGKPRGEPSAHLPATAFVAFLQNHDQVGNRAFGERINSLSAAAPLRAVLSLLLLLPSPPLLFMGQEWGCVQPFLFFCDLDPELAESVTAGRRREFALLPGFRTAAARARIPDPMDEHTFRICVLDWTLRTDPAHRSWLRLHRELLALRRRELIPRLRGTPGGGDCRELGGTALRARWILGDGSELLVLANLGDDTFRGTGVPPGRVVYATHATRPGQTPGDILPPWSVVWYLHSRGTAP